MSRLKTLKLTENFENIYTQLLQSALHLEFHKCANILETMESFDRNQILQLVEILRYIFNSHKKNFHMSALLYTNFSCPHPFLRKLSFLFLKNQVRAQKKIYFWWIPLCYDPNSKSGQKMAQKSYETYMTIF
jgi:hypothetical protein